MKLDGRDILGVGVDIVELDRVKGILSPERFCEYFLTNSEIRSMKSSKDRIGFIASRFAAKEAVIKAFPGLIKPKDFEISKRANKPKVSFLKKSDDGNYKAMLSISHSTAYAIGYAVITKR